MHFNKENLDRFLIESSNLNKKIPVKEKTFMDISGYPHYENVCSNILAFYFNPNEEHNLGDVVVRAFCDAVSEKIDKLDNIDTSNLNIEREYSTIKGNRLDILMTNDNVAIGIENKIYAALYNDLSDYSETIDKLHKNQSIKVVLSLYNNEDKIKNTDFINITYKDFFDKLKLYLDDIENKCNKWYIFLQEFVKNLEDYKGDTEMTNEIIEWMSKHENEIKEFYKLKDVVNDEISKKEKEIKQLLEDKFNIDFVRIWDGDLEKSCYIDSPKKYHVDATLSYTGWKIGIFTWNVSKSNYIKQILDNSEYKVLEDDGNHRWIFKYDYNEPIDSIINKVIELYNYFENHK